MTERSFANGNGQGAHGMSESGPSDAATPLLTTGRPPQPDHWWYLA